MVLLNVFDRFAARRVEDIGKTLGRESTGSGHLFTICARFADGTGCVKRRSRRAGPMCPAAKTRYARRGTRTPPYRVIS